jgi:hypothetical protein
MPRKVCRGLFSILLAPFWILDIFVGLFKSRIDTGDTEEDILTSSRPWFGVRVSQV